MSEKLVLMQKDGERLEVHPSCVKAHEEAGWSVSEKKAAEPKPEEGEPKPKPEKG